MRSDGAPEARTLSGGAVNAPDARKDPDARTAGTFVLRVLVAEDHPVNQLLVRRMLQHLGHEVVLAGDGTSAVAQWREGAFDLVLMDLQMPGMDGWEASAKIRAEEGKDRPRTLIVALTAQSEGEDAARWRKAGIDGYLAKPIEPGALAAVLSRAAQARVRAAVTG